ncbi:hypothetical protein, partial [Arthrobacter sp.]|uniref:hypothetical protein n=1 Tax=Arthrobacter sp. TaxID=1667 RepID=UPI002899B658
IDIKSPYGSAKVMKLQPGESTTAVIKTRQLSIPAGELTAHYKFIGKGKAEKIDYTASYGAVKCSR